MQKDIICRNYDCVRLLTEYEINKLGNTAKSLQKKVNYCYKCRQYLNKISRIQCHYCKKIIPFTTCARYVCDTCKKERRTLRLYNTRTAPNGFKSKITKLYELLSTGVYTKTELIDKLDSTPYALNAMLVIMGKKHKIEKGYTIK
jgi:hypothetical protein